MQFTLKCRDVSGSVSFPAESIDGLSAPERRYQINDHLVILDGPDYIVHHDVSELLKMPGGLFRMLTMQEQDELSLAAQQAAMAQESLSAPVVDSAPPALPDSGITISAQAGAPSVDFSAVADQSKKKASGG